jgi:type III restriction enzyme
VHFNLDYVDSKGGISNYYPDFIVKLNDDRIVIVETKGLEEIDVPLKMARLAQWCSDINTAQKKTHFDYVFVDEAVFKTYTRIHRAVLRNFTNYITSTFFPCSRKREQREFYVQILYRGCFLFLLLYA